MEDTTRIYRTFLDTGFIINTYLDAEDHNLNFLFFLHPHICIFNSLKKYKNDVIAFKLSYYTLFITSIFEVFLCSFYNLSA